MNAHTAKKTPACGQDEEISWIKSKCRLVKDCCEPTRCGCLSFREKQYQNLHRDLNIDLHSCKK